MELMENRIRPYAWGSRTAIAELLGIPSPSPHPQAELWIGAHPGDPSSLVCADGHTERLNAVIDADPVRTLGQAVYDEFGPRLPFLLKVLAAAEPLSLQAHPSTEQAERGFDSEDRAGIALNAHRRNYKDRYAQARTDLRADRVRGPVRIPGALDHRAVALRTAGAGARPLSDVAVRAARCARHAGVVLLDPHRAARSARAAAGRRARGVRAQGAGEVGVRRRVPHRARAGGALSRRPRGASRRC